ncbi:MAG: bifunctional nuclease family protein [Chitinispirillaceae bacterium]|nr:bifunctional nuclease family protein [Chitinispirillaceae bacterium]
MMIQMEITSFALDTGRNTPVIILKEKSGERTLPVPVGPLEAGAIAIQSLDVTPEKPLSIDLAKLIMEQLGGRLRHVVIHDIVDQSLLARLNIVSEKGTAVIECRPSDAIAMAMRCDAPLFVEEMLLNRDADGKKTPEQDLRRRIRTMDTIDFGSYFLE